MSRYALRMKLWKYATRRSVILLFVIGVGVPLLYCVWMCFGWPPAIEISHETTRLTEPLTADGRYVDYLAAIKSKVGEQRIEDDLWHALCDPDDKEHPPSAEARQRLPDVSFRRIRLQCFLVPCFACLS